MAGAKTLQSISTRLIPESTPESLYAQILGAAMELMASDCASVQMLAADQTWLKLLGWRNFHPDSAAFWERVDAGAGSTCSKALSDNERVVVADVEASAFMAGTQDLEEYRRSGIRAVQSTPLQSRSGRPLGMLSTHWRTPHDPTEDDFRLFDVLARQAADLIERTLAEEALRESEGRFRLIANTAPVMIWMSGTEGQISYLNQTWIDYTGRPLDAVVGQRQADVLHPDEAERCVEVYGKAFKQREPFRMEHRLRRHDGEYGWTVTAGVPRYDVDGSFAGYIGTAVDITERKLAEEALSTVSQKLIEAHEEEGARIARELHDDINQRLALASVRLGYLKQSPPASAADLEQEIGAVSQEIADLVADIQALSHGLHPARLELLGLERAAAAFCDELSNRHDVTIDVRFENIPSSAATGNLPVSLPRPAGSPAERRQAWRGATCPRLPDRPHQHHRTDRRGLGRRLRPSRGDERARARLDQHEGAVEGHWRAAGRPLAAGARHDDSRSRAALSPDEVCGCRSMSKTTRTDKRSPAPRGADSHDLIRVQGARVNNLKDLSVEIPKRRLTVFTGISGSGKSSLVFGTIAAESQRLINETYSAFVQGFMPTLARPDVDVLDGLTTAIIVDQERMGANPRSTVGTATDANAMLRILFSRLGRPHIGPPNAYSFNVPSVKASGAITVERGAGKTKTEKATFNRLGGMCPRCEGMGS